MTTFLRQALSLKTPLSDSPTSQGMFSYITSETAAGPSWILQPHIMPPQAVDSHDMSCARASSHTHTFHSEIAGDFGTVLPGKYFPPRRVKRAQNIHKVHKLFVSHSQFMVFAHKTFVQVSHLRQTQMRPPSHPPTCCDVYLPRVEISKTRFDKSR